MNISFRHSIAIRLIVYIFVFSSIITLILSIFQLYLDYSRGIDEIESRIQEIKESSLESLTSSLWDLYDDHVHTQLEGITQLPSIQYVEIREKGKILDSAGSIRTQNIVTATFPMIYRREGQHIPIGELYIVASLENLYERLWDDVMIILLSNALRTFLVSAFIFFLFEFLVTRHLLKISQYLQQFSSNRLDASLNLQRKPQQDELEQVVITLNQVTDNLNQTTVSKESLENSLRRQHVLNDNLLKATTQLQSLNRSLKNEISERKKTEEQLKSANAELSTANTKLKETQMQLVQSAKLASIGELATGIAHELNQPLMYIRNSAQTELLDGKENLDLHSTYETLQMVEEGTDRMMAIIEHLRNFARQSDFSLQSLDLHEVLENSMVLLDQQLKLRSIALEKKFTSNCPKIIGDPYQLEQVFVNLLTNARDALESCPTPKLIIQTEYISNDGDSELKVHLIDNGEGMAESVIEKIFDPFFTTKEPGKGTGLGLSISYGIIQKHKGQIQVSSIQGKGTTFTITFFPNQMPFQGRQDDEQI